MPGPAAEMQVKRMKICKTSLDNSGAARIIRQTDGQIG